MIGRMDDRMLLDQIFNNQFYGSKLIKNKGKFIADKNPQIKTQPSALTKKERLNQDEYF